MADALARSRYHPVVWSALVVVVLFGLSYTLLVPPYRGPDEFSHVDMVMRYQTHPGYPNPTEHTVRSGEVLATERIVSPRESGRPPQHADDAPPRDERPTFEEIASGNPPSDRYNNMTQHPPLYYAVAAGASTLISSFVPQGLWSWDREVELLRVLGLLGAAALVLLAAEAALAVGLGRSGSAVAAAVVTLVPMHTFIASVVNNEVMASTAAGIAIVGTLGYWREPRLRWAIVAAAGCAVAPLTKSTVAAVSVWAALLIVIAAVREHGWRAPRAVRDAAIAGVGALVGLSWQITNLIRFSDPQPNGFNVVNAGSHDVSAVEFARTWIARVASTFFGQPARRTGVTLAPWMIVVLTVAVVGVCAFALLRRSPHRWAVAVVAPLAALQIALMLRTNWAAHVRTERFAGLQGRYLFSLLVPIAVAMAVAASAPRRDREVAPIASAVALAAGVAVHAYLGWSMLTDGYWAADGDGVAGQLRAMLAWSPAPHGVSVAILGATLLAGVAAPAVAIRSARSARIRP